MTMMTMTRHAVTVGLLAVLCFRLTLGAQEATAPSAIPAVVVPASTDEALVTFRLDADALAPQDITLGALTSVAKPDHQIVPEIRKVDVEGGSKDWTVRILVGNLIPFGESAVTVLVRGEPTRTVRFQKPGLVAKAPIGTTLEVNEGNPLVVVLENPTGFAYSNVRARLRFQHTDICSAIVDAPAAGGGSSQAAAICQDPATWTAFRVDKHVPVTLRVTPPPEWFRDAHTGFPRAATRSGVLALRFTGQGASPAVYEQALPLEVQFNPGESSVLGNLLRVAWWLLIGALIALGLRVAIPNYRRKESLKEQLADAEDATRDILVETSLQVLLKVEKLALDQLRRRSWILGPSFEEIAQRTDEGLVALRRKIEFTRRLDTARGRRLTMLKHDVPPTRLAAIDRQLDAACDVLLREKLTEQDWVFAQQRLEAADKLLAEPTHEEKEAFQAFLVQRWKSVSDFFKLDGRKLKIPDALKPLGAAFPAAEALPEVDTDGSEWIQRIGTTRADLQLTALEIVRDFLFLARSVDSNAAKRLTQLLTTPSPTELNAAQLLVREISEGVDVDQVLKALRRCEAEIEMTPEHARPDEKAILALRFRNPKLDTAAARLAIRCEWTIQPATPSPDSETRLAAFNRWIQRSRRNVPALHKAYGWEICHCFPNTTMQWDVVAHFYQDGVPIREAPQEESVIQYRKPIDLQGRKQDWGNRVERIFPEAMQLGAALLVPLATLAVTQSDEGTTGRWWELIGVGFGSEMIRSILTGKPPQAS